MILFQTKGVRMVAKTIVRVVSPYLRQLFELLRAEAIKLRARRVADLRTQWEEDKKKQKKSVL